MFNLPQALIWLTSYFLSATIYNCALDFFKPRTWIFNLVGKIYFKTQGSLWFPFNFIVFYLEYPVGVLGLIILSGILHYFFMDCTCGFLEYAFGYNEEKHKKEQKERASHKRREALAHRRRAVRAADRARLSALLT